MNTVFMRCAVFCMFGTNLSLRVHTSSSKDKLTLAINFSYSRLIETKLILLPSCIRAIFLQFIQNYLQHQVASKCVWLLLIINPESAVERQISKSMKLSGVEKRKIVHTAAFWLCNLTWWVEVINLWTDEKQKWWNAKSLIVKPVWTNQHAVS